MTIPDGPQGQAPNFRTSVIQLDRPGDPSVFDATTRAEAAEIITRYPEGQARSALGPMLHLVMSVQGAVTADGIAFCAELTGLTKAQVTAFATFYTMYKRYPVGDYLVSVCTNTLCGMLGGDEIYAAVSEQLGVGMNETTPDGTITLEHAECLAACDYAPVVTVNYEFYDNQTVGSARTLVSQLQSGARPAPTRGAPLCTFKQASRQIAGFFDEDTFAMDAPNSGEPTERGVTLAIERGESAPSYAQSDAGAPAPTADAGHPAPAAAGRATAQPTSAHDAPLSTSGSDPNSPSAANPPADASTKD